MQVVVHGIASCDTVGKARAWLAEQGVAYEFHDFKKLGLTRAQLGAWLGEVPLETLLNRRGTTWRALPDERKTACAAQAAAIDLMIEKPSVIKRPVLVVDGRVAAVGFLPEQFRSALL
jgi:arsenate reductase